MPLQNIKYGGDSIIRGGDQRETETLYNIIVDGSKQFTYLDNELFQTLVNTVSSSVSIHGHVLQLGGLFDLEKLATRCFTRKILISMAFRMC